MSQKSLVASVTSRILHIRSKYVALLRQLRRYTANLVLQIFGGWPPSPSRLRKHGPALLLIMFGPLVVEGLFNYFYKPQNNNSNFVKRETEKRMRTLREIINDEKLHLSEAKSKVEDAHAASRSDSLSRSSEGTSGSDSEDNEQDDDDNMISDEHTTIESMVCAIEDVEEIDEELPDLREAFVVAAEMMGRELGVALRETVAQNNEKFQDGEKLRELLYTAEWLQTKLIGTPFDLQEFWRMPSKYLFGEDYPAYTRTAAEKIMFHQAFVDHLKEVKQHADEYIRETESTWFKKALYVLLRFREELPLIFVGNLFAIAHGSLGSLSTLYESKLINSIRETVVEASGAAKVKNAVTDIGIAMLIAHLIETATQLYSDKLNSVSQTRMGTKLQQDVFHHILQQDIEYWDVHESYEVMHYVSSAKSCLFWLLDTPNRLLEKIASIVTTSIILCNKSPALFGILMASRIVQITMRAAVSSYNNIIRRKMKKGEVTKHNNIWELLVPKNFRTLRSFAREPLEHEEFVANSDMSDISQQRLRTIEQITTPIFNLLNRAPEIFALYYGGSLVAQGALDAGDLLQFVHLGLSCVNEVSSIVNEFGEDMYNSLEPVAKIYDLLERKPKIGLYGGIEPTEGLKGEIRLENVSFSYPARAGAKVLRGLDLTAEAGQLTALVGPSGSGKSTVMGLIERFYDPSQGSIYVDGQNVRELCPLWLRKQIAIVPQEPVLFNKSIRENMIYGCIEPPSQEEIEDAAKAAHIYEFIVSKCPEKWRTEVGKDGIRLSGGQKQRLAIARAILMKPKILLLDEATASLDQESEGLVQQALESLMKGKTTLAIAHRLSTIRNASKIICIKNGRLHESGTHAELMAKKGLYCKYWMEQSGQSLPSMAFSEDSDEEVLSTTELRKKADGEDDDGEGNDENAHAPKTPQRGLSHEKQLQFSRLQQRYAFFLPSAKHGNISALTEVNKVFNELEEILNLSVSHLPATKTFSEPRERARPGYEGGKVFSPSLVSPIPLRRTKSYEYSSSRSSAPRRPKHPPMI